MSLGMIHCVRYTKGCRSPIQSLYNHCQWPFFIPTHSIFCYSTETVKLLSTKVFHFLKTFNNSAMLNNNGDANESRKRKLKQIAETRQSHAQETLNVVAPFKSFTAMLTEADSSILTPNVQDHSVQVDQMINTHNENLRRGLAGIWGKLHHTLQCAAEERAAEILKEKEMEMMEMAHRKEKLEAILLSYRADAQRLSSRNKELEEMVANYRAEADSLSGRLMSKEQLLASLTAALRTAATSARLYQDRQEEDAESSFVDPESQDYSVKLKCKVCEIRLATVMLWPCSHVCICPLCEATTRSCPVCRTLATTSVRVHLPLN